MTLVEVMLAIFVLVLLFGAALSAIVQGSRLVYAARNRTRAVAILNQKMEEMRALTFSNLTAGLATPTFTSGTIPASPVGIGLVSERLLSDAVGREFRWTRTAPTNADEVGVNMLKVVVTVQWTDLNRTASVTAFSYFSSCGVLIPST